MFKATRPFNDKITNYPKEPSLRIGRCVPKNAVNLAYYFNPTATDAEKVLAAEAPRNTIDHRVEEAYRYLFNQSSDDDDLFPKSILYEDEEGYSGPLGRMYVQWYPEAHIETKNIQQDKEQIVEEKNNVLKMIEYSDPNGYKGNLYLDSADYEVTKTKDVTTTEMLDYEVYNHELSYHTIFGSYISPQNLDTWMNDPTGTNTLWPKSIYVDALKFQASGGNNTIQKYVASQPNTYEGAQGELVFDKLEYEQVPGSKPPTDGSICEYKMSNDNRLKSDEYQYTGDLDADDAIDQINAYVQQCKQQVLDLFKSVYCAVYNTATDKYEYDSNAHHESIEDFLALAQTRGPASSAVITRIRKAMDENKDIVVYLDRVDMEMEDTSKGDAKFWFKAKYNYKISDRGAEGTYMYNVIARYKGVLKHTIITKKEVPAEYRATCHYVGIARKVWYDYDGVAYYRGAITKGNAVGNVNPDGNDEILMFSDDKGYLRIPKGLDENGKQKNFYRVESDHIYLTDIFKDGVACFYKYPLKLPIYDYRGPDDNGFYEGDAVKIFTSGLKNIPDEYKHSMKLRIAEYETVKDITNDFQQVTKEVARRYNAELYTSFISSSTDTFKVVYNAYDDNDTDNIALDNGVIEDIYNYPFMHKGTDFFIEPVDAKARVNKIRLPEPRFIEDTRHYITFSYQIKAERKPGTLSDDDPGAIITSEIRTVSILNKDYVVPAEYDKFDGRAMIISPKIEGILYSPLDLILYDQAARRQETVITRNDSKNFIFSAIICELESTMYGSVNLKCNTDGSGYITAETTVETGFYDEYLGTYTKKLCLDSPYFIENGRIYPGFKVKCVDTRHIKVQAPREEKLLESWYPRIQFGHYSQILDQYGTHIKVCYTMPEYDTQHYSEKYGCPYVDILEEQVTILNSHMVKTQCFPLLIKDNETTVSLFKKLDDELFEIHIQDLSFSDGIIITKETISENDNIICNYTYVEESYIYRGYWRNQNDFARIDLNPNKYHTYNDLTYTPSEVKPSRNLFNKVIYFFMRPTVEYEVSADNDSLIFNPEDDTSIGEIISENKDTIYHQIDNSQPESDHDIYIGSVYIRQNTSLHSTILTDSRTRGGGVLESMKDSLRKELEPESDYYLDIGYYDGEPYQENGVIIVRLDNSLLKEFGGRFTQGDIEAKVKRWLGFGVYPIIEYVDSYSKRDMPQYNLEVEDSYVNVTDETPEILLECVSVS